MRLFRAGGGASVGVGVGVGVAVAAALVDVVGTAPARPSGAQPTTASSIATEAHAATRFTPTRTTTPPRRTKSDADTPPRIPMLHAAESPALTLTRRPGKTRTPADALRRAGDAGRHDSAVAWRRGIRRSSPDPSRADPPGSARRPRPGGGDPRRRHPQRDAQRDRGHLRRRAGLDAARARLRGAAGGAAGGAPALAGDRGGRHLPGLLRSRHAAHPRGLRGQHRDVHRAVHRGGMVGGSTASGAARTNA